MRHAGSARLVICGCVILIALSTPVNVLPSGLAMDKMGQIRGTVKDPQGAVVPGATVTIERYGGKHATDETGKIVIKDSGKYKVKRKAVTDNEGRYDVRLPPGIYRVIAEHDSKSHTSGFFKFQGEPFLLTSGGTKVIDITLRTWAADVITIP